MYHNRTVVGFNYNFISFWYILSVLGICSLSIYGVDHRPYITSRKAGDEVEVSIYTNYLKFITFVSISRIMVDVLFLRVIPSSPILETGQR